MGKFQDLTGRRFGRLTVVDRAPNRGNRAFWKCVCDCGKSTVVQAWQLTSGKTKSCGCLRKDTKPSNCYDFNDLTGTIVKTYTVVRRVENKGRRLMWLCRCECGRERVFGADCLSKGNIATCECQKSPPFSQERLYHVWKGMLARCYIKSATAYSRYGGRGISVCDEWKNNYASFRDWAFANGYDENAPYGQCTIDRIDNNGNYKPSNCRWVDIAHQANNNSHNVTITVDGETHTRQEWSRLLGVNFERIRQKMRRGISGEEAVLGIMEDSV